ncbi:hypothetical protein HYPSUDRAFT_64904 [Hypholoma sublateritium FD-334 SS-4]|uniref:Uncharacterized protein n=1 Tax=Hypholoma sublateritium (strain FD-334 SS-4) TaxID=945553 RepID=A0A0D2Q1B6_HYPSF|nr:hypothetical protein HYPSUDRAFT_64904 [Hypholoma sublateritium FD-334 SS-4]
MSHPSKPKPIAYADAVKTFNAADVQDDINDACGKLATAMSTLMQKFDSITRQMHTIDLLRLSAPLKPRWDSVRQDLAEILWQFRTNSSVISGRLKLFYTEVLPLAARTVDGRSGGSSCQIENIQVLKSFMTLSAEHAASTMTLAERIFRLSAQLIAFMTEFTNFAARHAASGQKEMCDLAQRLSELDSYIQRLVANYHVANIQGANSIPPPSLFSTVIKCECCMYSKYCSDFSQTRETSNADVTHLAFTASRLVSSAGHTTGRSRITRKPIILDGELINIGRAYEHTDKKRSEVAHAQYNSQLRQDRVNPLATAQTMFSAFLLDQMLTSECGLGIFMAIWDRLRTDCSEIYHWVKNPQIAVPVAILCYRESKSTLYGPLATSLDVFATAIDPSVQSAERRGPH